MGQGTQGQSKGQGGGSATRVVEVPETKSASQYCIALSPTVTHTVSHVGVGASGPESSQSERSAHIYSLLSGNPFVGEVMRTQADKAGLQPQHWGIQLRARHHSSSVRCPHLTGYRGRFLWRRLEPTTMFCCVSIASLLEGSRGQPLWVIFLN